MTTPNHQTSTSVDASPAASSIATATPTIETTAHAPPSTVRIDLAVPTIETSTTPAPAPDVNIPDARRS